MSADRTLRHRAASIATGVVAGLAVVVALVTLVFAGASPLVVQAYGLSPEMRAFIFAFMALLLLVVTSYGAVGALLVGRAGAVRMGGLLSTGALAFSLVPFSYLVGGSLAVARPDQVGAQLLFLLGPALNALGFALILPVPALLFPDGRLPSPRWRPAAGLSTAMLLGSGVAFAVRPGAIAGGEGTDNPLGIPGLPGLFVTAGPVLEGLGVLAMSALAIVAVAVRYRRGTEVVRLQLRWFVAAVILGGVPLAISVVPGIGNERIGAVALVGLAFVPVSILIAVTRYRLYEIDRLVSRSLSWALLTGALVGVYGAVVIVLQGLLVGVTQGGTLAVAASTLAAAALFQPLRRRIQHLVDRRFDRARYDAERTASAFADRLRDRVELAAVEEELLSASTSTMNPRAAALWLRTAHSVTMSERP